MPGRTRHSFWAFFLVVMILLGIGGSILGADTVAHNDSAKAHQTFVASAAEIASTLHLALLHEQDLTISAGAVLIRNPDVTQDDFLMWMKSVRAFARYPELQTIFDLQIVPASQIAAFGARQLADPSGPLSNDGTFEVTPQLGQPYYCLATVTDDRKANQEAPAGIDYCQTALRAELLKARIPGRTSTFPMRPVGSSTSLLVLPSTAVASCHRRSQLADPPSSAGRARPSFPMSSSNQRSIITRPRRWRCNTARARPR